MSLLAVRDLSIELAGRESPVLQGVSFDLPSASITGLFGESGCGKTTLALSLLNLLPAAYSVTGSIKLEDRELLGLAEREWQRIRGSRIAIVLQDPLLALNPVLRAGTQVAETIRAHTGRHTGISDEVLAALRLAGLAEAERVSRAFPHELSGGERQRVAIAQALACRPSLIIADEPFSALDPIHALELTAVFRRIQEQYGTSFLLISHDPGVLARSAGWIMVMKGGTLVETGAATEIFRRPTHPYTAGLLDALTSIGRRPGAA
jgi:ABC-type glutathione transport system ATPase component